MLVETNEKFIVVFNSSDLLIQLPNISYVTIVDDDRELVTG